VTELVLIVALEGLALALVLLLVRAHAPRADAVGTGRVISALERASAAFLGRERLRLAPAAALVALVLFALSAALGHPSAGIARAAGALLGAALGALVAAGGARVGGLAGGATLDAARARFDTAQSAALRLGGAAGLGAQAAGGLGAALLLAAEQALSGAVPTLSTVATLGTSGLPGYAIGAALAAFSVDRAASSYGAAAGSARHRAALREPSLSGTDARNPALVAGLVGAELRVGAQATRTFALTAILAVVALVLPARLGMTAHEASRLAALGLILPAFGLVACATGLLVARTEEAAQPAGALVRGLASAATVTVLGLIASTYWLYPECWPVLSAAGAVGLLVATASGASLYPALRATSAGVRDAQAALQAGAGTTGAAALASGLRHAGVVVVLLAGGALASDALGAASGLAQGARVGLFVALAGALALLPFAVGVSSLHGVAESALGILAMAPADAEVIRRTRRLEDTARATSGSGETYLTSASGLLAAGVALALSVEGDTPAPLLLAAAGVAGAALVLTHGSMALAAAARGARDACLEVDRQLDGSGASDARGAPPSYRACEEQCARIGLQGAPLTSLLAFVLPVMLGIALDLVYRGKSPRVAAEAFAVFTAGAAVTALWVALTANGARAVLLAVRRASRPDGDPAIFAASVGGNSLTDILGSAAGPTACSLSLMASSIGLLVPFLR
jgi:H+-translocating diphosphatase